MTRRRRRKYLYFVRVGDFVKVGITISPSIRAYRHSAPKVRPAGITGKFKVLGCCRARIEDETAVKRRFRELRASGRSHEWFQLTPEMEAFIESLNLSPIGRRKYHARPHVDTPQIPKDLAIQLRNYADPRGLRIGFIYERALREWLARKGSK